MKNGRLAEIDMVRGGAVIAMVLYHFLVDLELIFNIPLGVFEMPLVALARATAGTFLFVTGVSAVLKYERVKNRGIQEVVALFIKRALHLLFWGAVISGVTYFLFREDVILFGVLHFIGTTTVLIIPFLFMNSLGLLLWGIAIAGAGIVLIPNLYSNDYWLLPLGITPPLYRSWDYFPIFPWMGVVLMGMAIGKMIALKTSWKSTQRRTEFKSKWLQSIGQNSLSVYLLHQPILWGLLLGAAKIIQQ